MLSILLKLFILCLALRQLEATRGEGGSSHHGVQSQNSPVENKEQYHHHHGAQNQSGSPGIMKFTVVSELFEMENPEFEGALIDFGVMEPGKCRGKLLENGQNGNPRFSVDWASCGVKTIPDLLKIRIHPEFKKKEGSIYLQEWIIPLDVPYADLGRYFKGDEAIIELPVNGSPIVYLKGSARPNPASQRSKKPHLATFIVQYEQNDVVFHHVANIRMTQKFKTCESEMLPDKSGFTVDWAKCERGIKEANDLAEIQIRLKFRFKDDPPFFFERIFEFKDVRPDLEHLFNGGKARIFFPSSGEEPDVTAIKEEEGSDATESSGHHGHGPESPKPHNESPSLKVHLM